MIIHFGKKKSARIYVGGLILTYSIILLAPFLFNIPYTVLIALLTLPLAIIASVFVLKFNNEPKKMIPALGMNVGVVILTDLLLGVGFLL